MSFFFFCLRVTKSFCYICLFCYDGGFENGLYFQVHTKKYIIYAEQASEILHISFLNKRTLLVIGLIVAAPTCTSKSFSFLTTYIYMIIGLILLVLLQSTWICHSDRFLVDIAATLFTYSRFCFRIEFSSSSIPY